MHWILQEHFFNSFAFEKLLETLARFNLPYSVHRVTPFTGVLTDPEAPCVKNPVICMGSYSMRHVVKSREWSPGIFDLGPFDFRAQREKWGQNMLNFDSTVTQLKDAEFPLLPICLESPDPGAASQPGRYLKQAFVRPVEDSKAFTGKLFTRGEFDAWKQQVCGSLKPAGALLREEILIQISVPKTIHAEYRFWVVRGEIVCASTYKVGKSVRYSDEVDTPVFDFVRARIGEWQPHEAFVIDVCEVQDSVAMDSNDSGLPRSLKIVEINTLNSSAFYACDIPRLVMALEEGFGEEVSTAPEVG